LVLLDVREGYWGIADRGIYFLMPATGTSPVATALRFFDFASATVSTVAAPPALWENVHNGVSVSHDGRFVLWTQLDNAIKDLMLIDPWKP